MDTQVAEFSDSIMQVLLQTLSDPAVDRTIKPQILSSFGDIALAVGDKFETYLAHVLPMLQGAQHLSVEQQRSSNEALFDYNTQLRLGILEAYAGIVHALSNEKIAQYMTRETPVGLPALSSLWWQHHMSCHAILCNAILCNAILCNAILCNAILCNAILCNAILCSRSVTEVMFCYPVFCYPIHLDE